jgi:hypothetical protein
VAKPSRIGTQLGCLDIGSLPVQLGMPNDPPQAPLGTHQLAKSIIDTENPQGEWESFKTLADIEGQAKKEPTADWRDRAQVKRQMHNNGQTTSSRRSTVSVLLPAV